MNRLQAEFRRLYLPCPPTAADDPAAPPLIDPEGRVRALVLSLSGPQAWEPLSRVWRGVQTDLGWPAPGIAASGTDQLQLWFSLSEPVPARGAQDALATLRERYLPDVAPPRVALWPEITTGGAWQHARAVPAPQADGEHWSAFLAPDLAPLFADTPWLDIAPGDEGQASLLAGLASIPAALFAAGGPAPAPVAPGDGGTGPRYADPAAFLQAVMNDTTAPLALRIEAARALLNAPAGTPGRV